MVLARQQAAGKERDNAQRHEERRGDGADDSHRQGAREIARSFGLWAAGFFDRGQALWTPRPGQAAFAAWREANPPTETGAANPASAPEMSARARTEHWSRLNIWSAASSSGEEAYSIAITLATCVPQTPWHIEGTDISHRILATAKRAVYNEDTVRNLPPDIVRKHFQRGFGPQEGQIRVKAELREHVAFSHLNLLEGEPSFREPFQIIFCRNVMIYFERPTQEELVARLTRRLVPGGYLMVGHSESLTNIKHTLRSIRPAIYQRPLGA